MGWDVETHARLFPPFFTIDICFVENLTVDNRLKVIRSLCCIAKIYETINASAGRIFKKSGKIYASLMQDIIWPVDPLSASKANLDAFENVGLRFEWPIYLLCVDPRIVKMVQNLVDQNFFKFLRSFVSTCWLKFKRSWSTGRIICFRLQKSSTTRLSRGVSASNSPLLGHLSRSHLCFWPFKHFSTLGMTPSDPIPLDLPTHNFLVLHLFQTSAGTASLPLPQPAYLVHLNEGFIHTSLAASFASCLSLLLIFPECGSEMARHHQLHGLRTSLIWTALNPLNTSHSIINILVF